MYGTDYAGQTTTSTISAWTSATSPYIVIRTVPLYDSNSPYLDDGPFEPVRETKADLARAAMRSFLGSVRPSDHFRPPPPLRPSPPDMHQMVHRRRCQALGPRRPQRFSRA
jgi:hypothetical protein